MTETATRNELVKTLAESDPALAAQIAAPLLTSEQAAQLLGVSEGLLRKWRERGRPPKGRVPLHPVKLGACVRYRAQDVLAAMQPKAA